MHDDCVITLAGLLQLHHRCPMDDDLSWADEVVKTESSLAIMGAIDYDDDDYDEDGFGFVV